MKIFSMPVEIAKLTVRYTCAHDRRALLPAYPGCVMKKLALAFATVFVTAAPAIAGPCVALDYQEMKDMSVNDLVVEACKASRTNEINFNQYLLNIESSRGSKPFPEADKNYDVCKGQIDRMMRVVVAKGVVEKLPALCQQQADGRVINVPVSTGSAAQPAG
jgi:hypothetical protein